MEKMHHERECLIKLINSYQPGTLNLICGRPGMGKTTLAVNMALAARAPMAVFDLGQKWQHTHCDMPAQRIHIDRTSYQTADYIWEKVLQIQKTMPVRWVIIDWLQLIHPGQTIDENAKRLKAMAVELQVIVIALSGVRRSAEQRENKKPILQETREWELIEPWVDDVRILYRPDYYRIEEDEYGSTHDVCYIFSTERHQGDLGDLRLSWENLLKHTRRDATENISDPDILRQQLVSLEEEIVQAAQPGHGQLERNSWTEHVVTQLLKKRATIINRMFALHCTEGEVCRFEKVNDALLRMTNRFYAEHQHLRRQLDQLPDMGEPGVGRLTLFSQLNYCHDIEKPQLYAMAEDNFYGSRWNEMLEAIDSISKMDAHSWQDDERNNLDDGQTWAEGPLCIPQLEHICVCYLTHALCMHLPYSIPDLLRMTTYTCEHTMWKVARAKIE